MILFHYIILCYYAFYNVITFQVKMSFLMDWFYCVIMMKMLSWNTFSTFKSLKTFYIITSKVIFVHQKKKKNAPEENKWSKASIYF
jgi:hypothetical protein